MPQPAGTLHAWDVRLWVVHLGGGSGEYTALMVDCINDLHASNKELVILKLSYASNTDQFYADEHNNLSQVERGQLMALMEGLADCGPGGGATPDLSQLLMSDLIADRAADIIVVDGRGCRR